MKDQLTSELVDRLFAEIERAWIDRHDRTAVYKLADEHPELRDQLYEFFEDLVLGPGREPPSEARKAESQVADWLRSTGVGIARDAALALQTAGTTPTESPQMLRTVEPAGDERNSARRLESSGAQKDETLLAFLKRRTGQGIVGVARSLANASTEYVAMVSRYPQLVPQGVKQELARQIEERWGIASGESLDLLGGPPRFVKAASRSEPFGPEPRNFGELLERSALTNSQKQAWLRYAG